MAIGAPAGAAREHLAGAGDHQIADDKRQLAERKQPVAPADASAAGDDLAEQDRRCPNQSRLRPDNESGEAMGIEGTWRFLHAREYKGARSRSD